MMSEIFKACFLGAGLSALAVPGTAAAHALQGQATPVLTAENFHETVLAYQPVRRDDVAEDVFARGLFYLNQTKAAVSGNPDNFVHVDYWNLALAFYALGEPAANTGLAFSLAFESDPAAICGYIDAAPHPFEAAIPEVFFAFVDDCPQILAAVTPFDVEAHIADHDFDADLVREIHQISLDDAMYRPDLNEAQQALDAQNQARIDALFERHGRYIGRSMVGEELEIAMFLVIQHSNIPYMRRYLPHVHAAVREGELSNDLALKMLLDRIYGATEGYQFFGSQGSTIPLADDETRARIIAQYGIE
ncbi:hypothetical protein [Maricaulis sp.]|uniref:hypothetical protein n=1 Tax=Maricaulis sp. TaxID=1486257 RepID=UPI00260C4513|nr:hypothetical protein [Maricaulis sp.]